MCSRVCSSVTVVLVQMDLNKIRLSSFSLTAAVAVAQFHKVLSLKGMGAVEVLLILHVFSGPSHGC